MTKSPTKALIVMSCSASKRQVAEPVRFIDLYNGPAWQQLRKSGWSAADVACFSAGHGFLTPETKIAGYDRRMDDARLCEIGDDPEQIGRFLELAKQYDKVFVFGGLDYLCFIGKIMVEHPEVADKIELLMGTYLMQRSYLTALTTAWAAGADLTRMDEFVTSYNEAEALPAAA